MLLKSRLCGDLDDPGFATEDEAEAPTDVPDDLEPQVEEDIASEPEGSSLSSSLLSIQQDWDPQSKDL
eukprot:8619026-Pyramimonas_sp.AAC.1